MTLDQQTLSTATVRGVADGRSNLHLQLTPSSKVNTQSTGLLEYFRFHFDLTHSNRKHQNSIIMKEGGGACIDNHFLVLRTRRGRREGGGMQRRKQDQTMMMMMMVVV